MTSRTLALGLVAALLSTNVAHAAGQFPSLQSENLNQEPLNLPADFGASRSVLLIAYKQEQQPIVDTWFPFLERLAEENPDFRYYELPTITSALGLARGFIDGGMRSGIPDPAQRERTITLYTDVAALQRALGIAGTDTIHAVVVDEAGRVLEALEGPYSTAGANLIVAALQPGNPEPREEQ